MGFNMNASISALKLFNFHLTFLVPFVYKLFFCFVLKYLRLPVLTKYIVKNFFLCFEEGLNFCYFTLTLGHSYTYNAWKFKIIPFHKLVDMVYFIFATLIPPLTALGDEQFAFACKVFCWTSDEKVTSIRRNQNWSLLRQNKPKSFKLFTCSNSILSFVFATGIWDLIWTYEHVQKFWNSSGGKTSSTSST